MMVLLCYETTLDNGASGVLTGHCFVLMQKLTTQNLLDVSTKILADLREQNPGKALGNLVFRSVTRLDE